MGYRLPFFTALAIILDMLLGGLVVGLNAGFACPDWPRCNGSLLPPMQGLELLEYCHRFATSLLSVLILVTVFEAWHRRKSAHRWVPFLAGFAVLFLIGQIVLGAVIVKFVLPGWFTTIDVANSMLLLSTYAVWTAVCMPKLETLPQRLGQMLELRKPIWATCGVIFLQVVYGGFFRHSGAGEAYFGQTAYLSSHHETDIPSKFTSTALLQGHILLAVIVTVFVVLLFFMCLRKRILLWPAAILACAVLVQMGLGFASLATALALAVTTAHWLVSTVLLMVSVYMSTRVKLAQSALAQIKSEHLAEQSFPSRLEPSKI
ncbi:MAG: cytochrome oxidase assembly [Bacilli bacterium]|nr:cytochrome oxidase assembly [Bacilli bacterium]